MSLTPLSRDLISTCLEGRDLTSEQVTQAVEWLVQESADLEAKAEFLQVLGGKGETSGEISAFVEALLAKSVRPPINFEDAAEPVIDVVGTGGDRLGLFNFSSSTLFVLAAAGVGVIKHGNRGITTPSGAADLLEALGAPITLGPDDVVRCFRETGIAFILAPLYHPALKTVAPVRKLLAERGIPTIFNKMAPLLNPAQPPYQLAGVFTPSLLPTYAHVLCKLGRKSAWIFHGRVPDATGVEMGADKLTPVGNNLVQPVVNGEAGEAFQVTHEDIPGLNACSLADLQGSDGRSNAAQLREILEGTAKGPIRDTIQINAGAGLVVTGKAPTLAEGFAMAGELIDNGAALAKLKALCAFQA